VTPRAPARVIVVGGGLTGLAAAVALRERGCAVRVLEAGAQVGGVVLTQNEAGFRIEVGPNSVAAVPAPVQALFARTGISARMIFASPSAKHRFILRGGRPMALPASPLDLPTTPVLSAGAKLRLLREPFTPAAPAHLEESIADFARRRLGEEVLDYLVNPFVGGVFAGDPERLSLRESFPKLHAIEQEHGSIIKGMAKQTRDGTMGGAIWSLPEGLGGVPATFASMLGDMVITNATVQSIRPRAGGGWQVTASVHGTSATEEADVVLYAAPAHRWAEIGAHSPELQGTLRVLDTVEHPPVAVVAIGMRREQVAHALDGFGLLVPKVERRRILGVLFPSSLFADRAPQGHVLLTAFVGGARQPELAYLDAPALETLVRAELRDLLGVEGTPAMTTSVRWSKAIPQYVLGYGRVRTALFEAETAHPGLVLAGTFRDGISVGDALASGLAAADRICGPA